MSGLASEQINELATALAKAQGEMESALHDKKNPHFKSSYASLNSIRDACRKPLSNHGLSVVQQISVEGEWYVLTSTLLHSSGQFMRSIVPICAVKSTIQSVGSSLTYMRRYSIAGLVGITTDEDDDGNEAQKEQKAASQQQNHRPLPVKPTPEPVPEPVKPAITEEQLKGFIDISVTSYGVGLAEFVEATAKTSNLDISKVWISAYQRQGPFFELYKKWEEKRKPSEEQTM